jgi:cytochrome c oxidase subunit 3
MAGLAKNHDYHMVEPSPWPFVMSVAIFILALGGIFWMHDWTPWVFFIGVAGVFYTMYAWWSDVIKEANNGVDHTPVVQMHHRYGMILFITSEVMLFVAFFWAYFDFFFRVDDVEQYARMAATGGHWPPLGVELFDPFHLPLFNTLLLLTSGTTVTWAHHALLENDREGLKYGLWLTVILGAVFTCVQAIEYMEAGFVFGGEGASMYGATFFMATGLHCRLPASGLSR